MQPFPLHLGASLALASFSPAIFLPLSRGSLSCGDLVKMQLVVQRVRGGLRHRSRLQPQGSVGGQKPRWRRRQGIILSLRSSGLRGLPRLRGEDASLGYGRHLNFQELLYSFVRVREKRKITIVLLIGSLKEILHFYGGRQLKVQTPLLESWHLQVSRNKNSYLC